MAGRKGPNLQSKEIQRRDSTVANCIYVRTYIYIYVYVYVCMYVCIRYISKHIHYTLYIIHIHMRIRIQIHIHIHKRRIHIHIHIHKHTDTHVCVKHVNVLSVGSWFVALNSQGLWRAWSFGMHLVCSCYQFWSVRVIGWIGPWLSLSRFIATAQTCCHWKTHHPHPADQLGAQAGLWCWVAPSLFWLVVFWLECAGVD